MPPLVGTLAIVGDKVLVRDRLHLFDGLELGAPALDPELLIEQRTVKPFHVAFKVPDADGALRRAREAGCQGSSNNSQLGGESWVTLDSRVPDDRRPQRPGSRRAMIGFIHPAALGGSLVHFDAREEL